MSTLDNSIQPDLLFNLLSDQTRLRCLSLIAQENEMCVCELTYALQLVQPKISRHLALLRNNNLLLDRRSGIWIYYRLHPELPGWSQQIITTAIKAIQKITPYLNDSNRLRIMPNRPNNNCCSEPCNT